MSGPLIAPAHQIDHAAAKAVFEKNGEYRIELSLRVVESEDPALNDQISPEEAALLYIKDAIALKFDEYEFQPEFGELKEADVEVREGEIVLYTEYSGRVPEGSEKFFLHVLPTAQVAVWMVVFKDGKQGRRAHAMFPGEYSNPEDLRFITDEIIFADPFAEPPGFTEGALAGLAHLVSGPSIRGEQVGSGALIALLFFAVLLFGFSFLHSLQQLATVLVFALLGHAIFTRVDFDLTAGLAQLLLGLAVLGIAVDNIVRSRWGWSRHFPIAVAAFVVGALSREIKIESENAALAGFYAGGVVAALALFGLFCLSIGTFWKKPWFRHQLIVPCSFLIAGIGAFQVFKATLSFF